MSWTSPSLLTAQSMKLGQIGLASLENVNGKQAILHSWHAVIQTGGMGQGHWPQLRPSRLRPSEGRMQHQHPGFSHYSACGSLCHRILMMGSNSTQHELLIVGVNVILKLSYHKNPIISMVSLNCDALGLCKLFKQSSQFHGIRAVQ